MSKKKSTLKFTSECPRCGGVMECVRDFRVFETIGFPAIVACWHMARTDRRLDENTSAINNLKTYLQEKK